MSTDIETRGWKRGRHPHSWVKKINGRAYEIDSGIDGEWKVRLGAVKVAICPRLHLAKRAAHAHARETK